MHSGMDTSLFASLIIEAGMLSGLAAFLDFKVFKSELILFRERLNSNQSESLFVSLACFL